MTAEEANEIIEYLKENIEFLIPNANKIGQYYYFCGAIDALMAVGKGE